MKTTYRIAWLGIPGFDITAATVEEASQRLLQHQHDYLVANLDQIDDLRRRLAEGTLKPTYTTLTIEDVVDTLPSPRPTLDDSMKADIVVRLFPEAC